jgi:hypothetical protein
MTYRRSAWTLEERQFGLIAITLLTIASLVALLVLKEPQYAYIESEFCNNAISHVYVADDVTAYGMAWEAVSHETLQQVLAGNGGQSVVIHVLPHQNYAFVVQTVGSLGCAVPTGNNSSF